MTKEQIPFTEHLSNVMPFFKHRNIIVEKMIGGFRALGGKYLTMAEVDKAIDMAGEKLNNSIIK